MNKEPPVKHFELSCMTGLPKVDTSVTLITHPVPNQSFVNLDEDVGDCACAVDHMPLEVDAASDDSAGIKRVRKAHPISRKELL